MLLPLAIAAVFAVLGQPMRAGVVVGLSALAALLILLGVPVASGIERGAKALGHGISTVAGVVVFLVVIGPAWTWSRIMRRDPFARDRAGSRWAEHSLAPASTGSLGSPTHLTVERRGLLSRMSWAVGCVVLLLAANYGVGWAWDEVKPADSGPSPDALRVTDGATQTPAPAGSETVSSTAPPKPVSETKFDPRVDVPAMQAYPWRDRYFQDLQRGPSVYWPYTQYRPMPFYSPYINIDGWSRRSYRTPGPTKGRPTVWMFGGSTTWGEGQRDEYTIASWLARLAEVDGIPLEIRNFGQRGWTHFQDMVLYEQQLALEGAPDLALFYDGVNEVNTQSFVPEAVPSHYEVGNDAQDFDGKAFATRFNDVPDVSSVAEDAWYAYSEHSMLHKVARWLTSSEPAGASPQDGGDDGTNDDVVHGGTYDVDVQDGVDAGKVYMRGQLLTRTLSSAHDVPTLFYWQPFSSLNPIEQAARDQIEPPTIDISELLLDHQDVYIDGAHTNEQGARIVAERIWEDLEPKVRAWYEEHR